MTEVGAWNSAHFGFQKVCRLCDEDLKVGGEPFIGFLKAFEAQWTLIYQGSRHANFVGAVSTRLRREDRFRNFATILLALTKSPEGFEERSRFGKGCIEIDVGHACLTSRRCFEPGGTAA